LQSSRSSSQFRRPSAEFIALSKKKAGEINYAANSRGTLPHLTAERFRAATGADLTFIPYPGAAAGMQDVVGGRGRENARSSSKRTTVNGEQLRSFN
jgi:tripartite-type tricarboxylate transporter receptor subunit TctC